MIRRLFTKLLAPHHPWRTVSFSELSEMYIASFLRKLSLGMIGIFIPLYLHQKGYSVVYILVFIFLFYIYGIANDLIIGRAIAYAGPKHIMRLSFLVTPIYLFGLIGISSIPYALYILPFIGSIATTMYWLPYNIDFSKIKHKEHGGKEVGFLQIVEQTAGILAPIMGGALATYINPQATFAAAAIMMFIAAVVIMMTPEPVKVRQPFKIKGLNVSKNWHDYAAFSFFCAENLISVMLWPFFLSLVVFTGNSYLIIGTITSISVVIAIVVALPLGKLIDNKRGKQMITYGTSVNSVVHILRLAVSGIFGAVFIALINEPNTLIYRIAFIKGYFDRADDYPGQRIAYIALSELFADIVRALTFGILVLVSLGFSTYVVCAVGFTLGAIYSQLIRLERLPALR